MPVPKHIVAVSGLVRNDLGEILLVKTHYRSDTWELPGGQVEEGEPLDQAVCREFEEETGIMIRPNGVTGIYYNVDRSILSVVFTADVVGGTLTIQPDEIEEAKFVVLNEENIDEYITRPHMKSRTLDAMRHEGTVPYESWRVDPYQRLFRLE